MMKVERLLGLLGLLLLLGCDSNDNQLMFSQQRKQLENQLHHERLLRLGLQAYIDSVLTTDTLGVKNRLQVYIGEIAGQALPPQTLRKPKDSLRAPALNAAVSKGVTKIFSPPPKVRTAGSTLEMQFQESAFYEGEGPQLSEAGEGRAQALAGLLKQWPTYFLTIESHMSRSSQKSQQDPWIRSAVRATALGLALRSGGLASERIRMVARGSEEPIAPDSTEAGRYLNRRIMLLLSPQ
jgi:flagellar motor protein MotB